MLVERLRATSLLRGPAVGRAPQDDGALCEDNDVMLRCERQRASKHAGAPNEEQHG